jgi:lipopolysaccharide export system ATP-binding protein
MVSKLTAKNLGKNYNKRRVIRDVSLELARGEVVGLLGPNGAGKTTIFYMIMGLVKPDYGTISLDDYDITRLPIYKRARKGVGYLPQESSIFKGLSVEENIMAVLEYSCEDNQEQEHMLDTLLSEFSITHLRSVDSVSLSGGERRRLEIARCLANKPKFVLLDEPLAGIDPIAIGEIKELIVQLKEKGIGVLITDHNVRDALAIIDRAYIIHDGHVLMHGTPKEIVKNKEVRGVYLGDSFTQV